MCVVFVVVVAVVSRLLVFVFCFVYLCAVSVVSLLLQHRHIRTVQIVSIIIKQILFF